MENLTHVLVLMIRSVADGEEEVFIPNSVHASNASAKIRIQKIADEEGYTDSEIERNFYTRAFKINGFAKLKTKKKTK